MSEPKDTKPTGGDDDKNPLLKREADEFIGISLGIEDPVLLILRVHLYVEYLLERIIQCSLPRGHKVIENARLTFAQKLLLTSSFGVLKEDQADSIAGLNAVRNACAHELHKKIALFDIDRIGRPLGPYYTQERRDHAGDLNRLARRILSHISGALLATLHISEEEFHKARPADKVEAAKPAASPTAPKKA